MRRYFIAILFVLSLVCSGQAIHDVYNNYHTDNYHQWLGSARSRFDAGMPYIVDLNALYWRYVFAQWVNDTTASDSIVDIINTTLGTSYDWNDIPFFPNAYTYYENVLDTIVIETVSEIATDSFATLDTLQYYYLKVTVDDSLSDIRDAITAAIALHSNYTTLTVFLDSLSDIRGDMYLSGDAATQINDSLSNHDYYEGTRILDSIDSRIDNYHDTVTASSSVDLSTLPNFSMLYENADVISGIDGIEIDTATATKGMVINGDFANPLKITSTSTESNAALSITATNMNSALSTSTNGYGIIMNTASGQNGSNILGMVGGSTYYQFNPVVGNTQGYTAYNFNTTNTLSTARNFTIRNNGDSLFSLTAATGRFYYDLDIDDDLNVDDDVTITDLLTVNGEAVLGNASTDTTTIQMLEVLQNSTMAGKVVIDDSARVNNDFVVKGDLDLGDEATDSIRLKGIIKHNDSIVTHVMPDTLVNTEYVRNNLSVFGGEVDTAGLPVSNQIAYFTAANKIGGDSYRTTDNIYLDANNNSAFGNNSQTDVTTGSGNSSLGYNSLQDNTGSSYNIAIGQSSLYYHYNNDRNTAIGASSMFYDTVGSNNTAIGAYSLQGNRIGNYNTAIGAYSLGNNDSYGTGSNNIGIGYDAGRYLTTESNRLVINSINRTNKLNDTTLSIIYGLQAALTANQQLYLNSNVNISDNLNANGILFTGSTQTAGAFYTGTTNPSSYTRLNYDGYLHCTGIYGTCVFSLPNEHTSAGSITSYFNSPAENVTGDLLSMNRVSGSTSYDFTGDFININDNPTTSGVISGKILTVSIGGTERTAINPRVSSGVSNEAYLWDTHNPLTGAKHTIWVNQGDTLMVLDSISFRVKNIFSIQDSLIVYPDSMTFTGYGRFDSVLLNDGTVLSDFVFEKGYDYGTLKEDIKYALQHKSLPSLKSHSRSIGRRGENTVEAIERLYLQINDELKKKDDEISILKGELDLLRMRLSILENEDHYNKKRRFIIFRRIR